MDSNTSVRNLSMIIDLLSAGVLAAFVTGIFSLIIAIKNNKKIIILEKNKQSFTVQQKKYEELSHAYEELLSTLPEDQKLGHYARNLHQHTDKKGRINPVEMTQIADANMRIMVLHFEKYKFLYDEDFCQSFVTAVKDLDTIVRRLAALQKDVDGNLEEIYALLKERFSKVAQLEELYYSSLKSQLSSIARKYEL